MLERRCNGTTIQVIHFKRSVGWVRRDGCMEEIPGHNSNWRKLSIAERATKWLDTNNPSKADDPALYVYGDPPAWEAPINAT